MAAAGVPGEHSNPRARYAAVGAIVLVVLVAAYLLLSGGGYTVKARFQSVNQLVAGGLVQASGRPVGTVKEVELTPDGEAEVTLAIDDEIAPLREGTRAIVRTASLSGVANRYVDLFLPSGDPPVIPDGGVIPSSSTTSNVDIDQLFSIFDRRGRRGLTNFIRGSAEQYEGRAEEVNRGWKYLNPSLVAGARLFEELSHDTKLLERFVVESSKLVTDLGSQDEELAQLVDRGATFTGAIARERASLSRAIAALPGFMRQANTTFVDLRSTLDDLSPLVEESKPTAKLLGPVVNELEPFTRDAIPTVSRLADLVRRTGEDNDLTELARTTLPFRDQVIGPVQRNGAERPGSFVVGTESLRGQTPRLAFLRPYAVDLTGWFDDFSHSGFYDANGSASRNALTVNAFSTANGVLLQPIPPALRPALFAQVATLKQNNRCPGSAERDPGDGSYPFAPPDPLDEGGCDPTQVPPGT